MTSEIEKHFHKHTVRVKTDSAVEDTEKTKNGFVSLNHEFNHNHVKNGFVTDGLVRIKKAEVVIEIDDRRGSQGSTTSESESSVE